MIISVQIIDKVRLLKLTFYMLRAIASCIFVLFFLKRQNKVKSAFFCKYKSKLIKHTVFCKKLSVHNDSILKMFGYIPIYIFDSLLFSMDSRLLRAYLVGLHISVIVFRSLSQLVDLYCGVHYVGSAKSTNLLTIYSDY